VASCYNQTVVRPTIKISLLGLCLAQSAGCVSCTLLNDTDYLDKDYGRPALAAGCDNVAGALFCEDFEGAAAPDTQRWTPNLTVSGATVEIDKSIVRSGTQSLHARLIIDDAGATDPYAMLYHFHPQPFPSHFFARAYFYVTSADVQTPETIVAFQMHDGTGGVQVALQHNWQTNQPPAVALEVWGDTSNAGQVTNPITYGRWECVTWEIDEDTKQANISLDGGSVLNVELTSVKAYDVLAVGVAFAGVMSAGTYEAWLDDVVVGTTPIGCGG
jgi:hypothetical protein